MAYFGLDLHEPPWQPSALPTLLGLDDPGALIGTLYVIEGATLGGEVISRHLHKHLELGPVATQALALTFSLNERLTANDALADDTGRPT
jgi:hypothetical protein